jgi:hypothetical protein
MKGGKLSLTYYSTPVSGLKVAEPTTLQYYNQGTNQRSVNFRGGSKKLHKSKSKGKGKRCPSKKRCSSKKK